MSKGEGLGGKRIPPHPAIRHLNITSNITEGKFDPNSFYYLRQFFLPLRIFPSELLRAHSHFTKAIFFRVCGHSMWMLRWVYRRRVILMHFFVRLLFIAVSIIKRSSVTSKLTSEQVDFQLTCPDGQVEILDKTLKWLMTYMWFEQIYFHPDKSNISLLVQMGKLR